MNHVFWVVPERLAGRPGPTSQAWSLPDLRAGGFDSVLNVSEFETPSAEFVAAGLDSAWIPMPNSYPADASTEADCLIKLPQTYAFVRARLAAGRRVLVHCAWGRDRTGLVLAYYLACSSGLSADESIAAVRQVRPKAITALGWEPMTRRLIAKLAPPPAA